MAFAIHPRLASGGFEIGTLGGCRLLLKNNALFPWFILIPEVEGIEDLHELPPGRYEKVMAAVRGVSGFVATYFQPEKLNVACIGNVVRQMHVQIIARSEGDPAWPATVWGFEDKMSYTDEAVVKIRQAARAFLKID